MATTSKEGSRRVNYPIPIRGGSDKKCHSLKSLSGNVLSRFLGNIYLKIFKNVVLCLPHKRLKVAKKELDSENESALPTPPMSGG